MRGCFRGDIFQPIVARYQAQSDLARKIGILQKYSGLKTCQKMRLPAGPAADFSFPLHINHFIFATNSQRLIFIRNRKLNVLFRSEEKKDNLCENYGLDMDRDLGKEIDDMCNFSDLIEERAIEQGIEQGRRLELDYGIRTAIKAYSMLGSSYEKARAFIIKEYNLSPSDAESKMQEYWEN